MPVHEHDCDTCTFIGSYRLKHLRCGHCWDQEHSYGDVTCLPSGYMVCLECYNDDHIISMADVYLACDNSGYKYIVRYGEQGEYATTNTVSHYTLAPMVDGEDPQNIRDYIYEELT